LTGSERNATLSGPTGERQAAVLEFFTVGGDPTAFLSGSVKGADGEEDGGVTVLYC